MVTVCRHIGPAHQTSPEKGSWPLGAHGAKVQKQRNLLHWRTDLGSLRGSLQAPGVESRTAVALFIAPLLVVLAAAAAADTAAAAGRGRAAHCLVEGRLPRLGAEQAARLEHTEYYGSFFSPKVFGDLYTIEQVLREGQAKISCALPLLS